MLLQRSGHWCIVILGLLIKLWDVAGAAATAFPRPIAYRNQNDKAFTVDLRKRVLYKNVFYIIGKSLDHGLDIHKVRAVKKKSKRSAILRKSGLYERYKEDDIQKLIAAQLKVPLAGIVLYARSLPLTQKTYRIGSSIAGLLNELLCARSVRVVSTENPVYGQAIRKSSLFFSKDMNFTSFYEELSRVYDVCTRLRRTYDDFGPESLCLDVFTDTYRMVNESYQRAAASMGPEHLDVLLQKDVVLLDALLQQDVQLFNYTPLRMDYTLRLREHNSRAMARGRVNSVESEMLSWRGVERATIRRSDLNETLSATGIGMDLTTARDKSPAKSIIDTVD